jgi:hypothetical protein
MAISRDLQLLIAAVIGIAGVAGFLAFRGWLRFVVLIVGLAVAAYMLGLLPELKL